MSVLHFWYSQSTEERQYENLASGLEFGYVSAWDIPRWNTCAVIIGGELMEQQYSLCNGTSDAYDGVGDRIYLGTGNITSSRAMKMSEIVSRMRDLGMIIPSRMLKVEAA